VTEGAGKRGVGGRGTAPHAFLTDADERYNIFIAIYITVKERTNADIRKREGFSCLQPLLTA